MNDEGLSAVHSMAATVLIEHGADLNSRADTWHGETPMMVGARANSLKAVQLLLERGADPTLKDRFGRTAKGYALWFSRRMKRLLSAG